MRLMRNGDSPIWTCLVSPRHGVMLPGPICCETVSAMYSGQLVVDGTEGCSNICQDAVTQ